MAQVPYYYYPALVAILDQLNITGLYETVGGMNVFTAANYQAALDQVAAITEAMLDDDNPDNDETAIGYQDVYYDQSSKIIYWSTEGRFWY